MSLSYFNPFFTVKVMDGLFISNQTASKDTQFLTNNKFSLIINTCPLQFKIPPIPHLYRVTNFHWQNSRGHIMDAIDIQVFRSVFDQIRRCSEEGYGVLVVSERGHSRAIAFVVLYLMDRWRWGLFKTLEYLNSKRENLEVRAGYLKLLVGYEKNIKGDESIISKEKNGKERKRERDNDRTVIEGEYVEKQQKQSDQKNHQPQPFQPQLQSSSSSLLQQPPPSPPTCPQQATITNTFLNSSKRHPIPSLNQQHRQSQSKLTTKDNKNPTGNNITTRGQSLVSAQSVDRNNGKRGKAMDRRERKNKSVRFSSQVEIIIVQQEEAKVRHVFPQYQELNGCCGNSSSSGGNAHYGQYGQHSYQNSSRNDRGQAMGASSVRVNEDNSNNDNNNNNENNYDYHRNEQQYQQQQQYPNNPNTQTTLITHTTPNPTTTLDPPAHHNPPIPPHLHPSPTHHTRSRNNPSSTTQHPHSPPTIPPDQLTKHGGDFDFEEEQGEDYYGDDNFVKQTPAFRVTNKTRQEVSIQNPKKQPAVPFKTSQLLSYQNRPSSLKKFKAAHLYEEKTQQKSIYSPKKMKKKDERTLTEPKYDYEFQNPVLEDEKVSDPNKSRRRSSASQHQDTEEYTNNKRSLYQHERTATTTLAMKMMNRFQQKKSSTPFRQQKRFNTPHISSSQISNKQLRSSSQNNFFTRPLSRGGSNSLKMATKKSVTSSINEQKQAQKAPGSVFNININVNIGKLEMFGVHNKNPRDSGQSIPKAGNIKGKPSKTASQADRSHLLYNRIRSNSSNDNYNYSKFSISSLSNHEKNDSSVGEGFESRLLNHKKEKIFLAKDARRMSQQQNPPNKNDFRMSSNSNEDQGNIFACESFSKRQILDKINRKLIKNSRNSKREQVSKKSSILENNFI